MREQAERLASAVLSNERTIWIRAPREPADAQSVVVFLDGETYRERIGAPELLDELSSAGEIADGWSVFVSVESDESRWRECPCHPPFAAFIGKELLPWLAERIPVLRHGADTTLIGASYTGLAAAYVAQEQPGCFHQIICQSGSFWWRDGWLIGQYASLTAPVPGRFLLQVGARETQSNLQHRPDVLQSVSQLDAVRTFRDALLGTGHDVTYLETDGTHDAASWRAALPDALRWASSHQTD